MTDIHVESFEDAQEVMQIINDLHDLIQMIDDKKVNKKKFEEIKQRANQDGYIKSGISVPEVIDRFEELVPTDDKIILELTDGDKKKRYRNAVKLLSYTTDLAYKFYNQK